MLDVILSSPLSTAATAVRVTMSTTSPISPSDRSWIILARGGRERFEACASGMLASRLSRSVAKSSSNPHRDTATVSNREPISSVSCNAS